jgi:hypothetical protein
VAAILHDNSSPASLPSIYIVIIDARPEEERARHKRSNVALVNAVCSWFGVDRSVHLCNPKLVVPEILRRR